MPAAKRPALASYETMIVLNINKVKGGTRSLNNRKKKKKTKAQKRPFTLIDLSPHNYLWGHSKHSKDLMIFIII